MKAGDYVRTKKGIAKYLGLGRDILKHEANKGTYEHYYNQHLFDNYIFDVGHDYGDTLIYDEFNNIDKLGKVKENIIDLIEVGDYVNGSKVEFSGTITWDKDKKPIAKAVKIKQGNYDVFLNENMIKSVVTKEQFSQMEYRIGE